MILTGKAKEDFKEWKVNNKNLSTIEVLDFEHLSKTSQNALIIDFFDSVGIYCVSNYNFINTNWSYSVKNADTILSRGCNYKTRKEATEQAIIKANEIYNSK